MMGPQEWIAYDNKMPAIAAMPEGPEKIDALAELMHAVYGIGGTADLPRAIRAYVREHPRATPAHTALGLDMGEDGTAISLSMPAGKIKGYPFPEPSFYPACVMWKGWTFAKWEKADRNITPRLAALCAIVDPGAIGIEQPKSIPGFPSVVVSQARFAGDFRRLFMTFGYPVYELPRHNTRMARECSIRLAHRARHASLWQLGLEFEHVWDAAAIAETLLDVLAGKVTVAELIARANTPNPRNIGRRRPSGLSRRRRT